MMANQIEYEQPSLPKEYTQLQYLESPIVNGYGKCYIDIPVKAPAKVIITLQSTVEQSTYTIPIGYNSNYFGCIFLCYKDDYYAIHKDQKFSVSVRDKATVSLTFDIDNNKNRCIGVINDQVLQVYSSSLQSTSRNFVLFSNSLSVNNSANFCGKIFSCKFLSLEGKELCNLIPALRIADSKPGFYDTVSGQFFINQGQGDFIYN